MANSGKWCEATAVANSVADDCAIAEFCTIIGVGGGITENDIIQSPLFLCRVIQLIVAWDEKTAFGRFFHL
jgi:hypothetical protein